MGTSADSGVGLLDGAGLGDPEAERAAVERDLDSLGDGDGPALGAPAVPTPEIEPVPVDPRGQVGEMPAARDALLAAVDQLAAATEEYLEGMRELYTAYVPQSRRPYDQHHAVLQALLKVERAR